MKYYHTNFFLVGPDKIWFIRFLHRSCNSCYNRTKLPPKLGSITIQGFEGIVARQSEEAVHADKKFKRTSQIGAQDKLTHEKFK